MMHHLFFQTSGFRDPASRVEQNINAIEGYRLACFLRDGLRAKGIACDEVGDEDYGWCFSARHGTQPYFCTTALDPNPDHPLEMLANINVQKHRSLKDKLLNRNPQTAADPVTAIVESLLLSHPEVRDLKLED